MIFISTTSISPTHKEGYIKRTSHTSNKTLVNLQDVPELKLYFLIILNTNTTVYLNLEVWDHDRGADDHIRNIEGLVIPFNETTTRNGWKVKRFNLSYKL